MLFGHLAVAALQHRYTKSALVPVTAAAVFPDAVDKVAHYVLGYNATGRMWGHTLIAAGLTSLVVLRLFGRHNAASWALGYLSHLLFDIEGTVPWLAPFVTYEFAPHRGFFEALWGNLTRPMIVVEIALAVWATIVIRQEIEAGRLSLTLSRQGQGD